MLIKLMQHGKIKNENCDINEINKKLIPLNMSAIYSEEDNMIYLLNRNTYECKFQDLVRSKKFDNLLAKYISSPEMISDGERKELQNNLVIGEEGKFCLQFLEQNRFALVDEYPEYFTDCQYCKYLVFTLDYGDKHKYCEEKYFAQISKKH